MAFQLISTASRIGLYAMVMMADTPEELVSVPSVAEAFNVSDNHVAKVLQQLSRAGLVTSTRGAGGGYRLARQPDTITMAEIIEALDGSLEPTCFGCEGRLAGACGHFAACMVRDVLTGIGSKTLKTFRTTSIATLAKQGRRRSGGDPGCVSEGRLRRS